MNIFLIPFLTNFLQNKICYYKKGNNLICLINKYHLRNTITNYMYDILFLFKPGGFTSNISEVVQLFYFT